MYVYVCICIYICNHCRIAELTGQSGSLNPRKIDIEANSGMSTMMTSQLAPMESTGSEDVDSQTRVTGLQLNISVIDHHQESGIIST